MNRTLDNFLECSNRTHKLLISEYINLQDAKVFVDQLELDICQIEVVLNKLLQIQRSCNRAISRRYGIGIRKVDNMTAGTFNVMSRTAIDTWRCDPVNCIESKTIEIAPNLNIRAQVVDSIEDVPNSALYWVKELECFAMQICGLLITGNLGEVFTSKTPRDKICQVESCKFGILCKNQNCRYLHPRPGEVRNFINPSWLHANAPLCAKNKLMRHFGSRSTMSQDITQFILQIGSKVMHENWLVRKSQLMHDILACVACESAM